MWSKRASAVAAVVLTLPWLFMAQAGPDLWWQVHTGQRILDGRSIPTVDDLSFTASGAAWTNHEWLAQIVFAGAFDLLGGAGLLLVRGLLVAGIAASLGALLARRLGSPLPALLATAATLLVLWPYLNLRVHTFTFFFATLAVLIAEALVARRGWALPAATVLMLVWVNTHGGFLLGLGFLSIVFTVDAISAPSKRRPLAGLGLIWVATLATPSGPGLYRYLVDELGANHSLITEWLPASTTDLLIISVIGVTAAWSLATSVPAGRPIERLRQIPAVHAACTLTTLLCIYATVRHARFVPLVVLFGALSITDATRLRGATGIREATDRMRRLAAAGAVALVVAAIATSVSAFSDGLRPIDGGAPASAVEFIATNGYGPNVASELDWGGYIIWELSDTHQVAVDGRNLTVYDDEWVDQLLRGWVQGQATTVLEPWNVDVWLVRTGSRQATALDTAAEWAVVYADELATVAVPASPDLPEPRNGTTSSTRFE